MVGQEIEQGGNGGNGEVSLEMRQLTGLLPKSRSAVVVRTNRRNVRIQGSPEISNLPFCSMPLRLAFSTVALRDLGNMPLAQPNNGGANEILGQAVPTPGDGAELRLLCKEISFQDCSFCQVCLAG